MMLAKAPICPYCIKESELADSAEVYSRSYGLIWLCRPCHAWVGTHKNSKKHEPLGRLANADLRNWKKRAHAAFDPLWQGKILRDRCTKGVARKAGYKWLAGKIGINTSRCHIGHMDIDMCKQVVNICNEIKIQSIKKRL